MKLSTQTTYAIFLISILAVVVGSQVIIQYGLNQQNDDAAHINLAGRQIMLSQRISKLALYIERDETIDASGRTDIRRGNLDTLSRLVNAWQREYSSLLIGAQSSANTPRIDAMLRENALRLDTLVVAAKAMIKNPYALTVSNSIKTIAAMENPFLEKMELIVNAYQQEAEQKLNRLKVIEIILSIVTLGIFALEFTFIFYPLIRKQQSDNLRLLEAARDLKLARDRAEAATQAKSEFLSSMSHEIRTPLNGVIGFSDLLMNTDLDETQKQYMSTVNSSARGLLDIINDVLDISKIEAGKFELAPEPVRLKDLVLQVTEVVRYQTKAKNLQLKLTLDSDLPETVELDPMRLRQVLINLMGNAVKFTSLGFIELKIDLLHKSTSNMNQIRFSVTDTGIGIRPENLKKIFQAFSQEDSTVAKNYGGTGLGLSISNKLLSLMKSKLQLASEVNKGSTFYFDLTVVASEESKNPIKRPAATHEQKPSGAGVRILIAEDNTVNMSLIKIILNKKMPGATLIEASNGAEAVEKFKTESFNMILMDIQMPELNGFEATRQIRLHESGLNRTPIIALTAGAISGEREKCLEAGMDDFLTKPISGEALDKALALWLSGQPI
jgi:signal transduction histidine kinase/ActR/RegA family two-component response regulator